MSVIAYAAGVADPISNPLVDPTPIDLAVVTLPAPDVELFGDLVDTGDGSPTKSFSWQILSGPAGHTATLDSSSAQNPKVQGIDVFGNYLVALVATNTNTPETSEDNPRLMPDSARVVIRCLGANRGLQKWAPGERNWTQIYHDLVQAVETGGGGVGAHTINSHSDVVNATGAELDTLRGGGYTSGLHIHKGDEVDAATAVKRGTVVLESSSPLDPANPVVINQERITLTAKCDVSYPEAGPSLSIVPNFATGPNLYHAAFRLKEDLKLDQWAVALGDGGASSPGAAYKFKLCKGDDAAFVGGTLTVIAPATLTGAPASDGAPMELHSASGLAQTLLKDQWVAVKVEDGSDAKPARSLTVTIHCLRQV